MDVVNNEDDSDQEQEKEDEEGKFFYISNEIKTDVHMENDTIIVFQHDFNADSQHFVCSKYKVSYTENPINESVVTRHDTFSSFSPNTAAHNPLMQYWKPAPTRLFSQSIFD